MLHHLQKRHEEDAEQHVKVERLGESGEDSCTRERRAMYDKLKDGHAQRKELKAIEIKHMK